MSADSLTLDRATASRLASRALSSVAREYPHKLDHTMASDDDVRAPRLLHPSFHASYDWHSCVHMHWTLARLLRRFPDLPEGGAIVACFDRHFAAATIDVEVAYLARSESASFERTYGWAWLLKLAAEVETLHGGRWRTGLAPLALAFAARFVAFLPRTHYPVRYGVHPNSAFALALALDYARATADEMLGDACRAKAVAWFGDDRDAPVRFEPSGTDFLSPSLVEAELMRRVLDASTFGEWLSAFLPQFPSGAPRSLFSPVDVVDRTDAQLVHLDGLNLSRAWCFRGIAAALPAGDPRAPIAIAASARHLQAGWEGLASDAFVGTHWLATFALLALDG